MTNTVSYVECSVPERMTLAEYRRARRGALRPRQRRLRRVARRLAL